MKLTEEQLEIINHYTDAYRIDREKLVSYLEKHRTIKRNVFGYCTRVSRRYAGGRGYCMFLDDEPMFTPVDRDTFIRRIPFYFYQMPMGGDRRSGLSLIIPITGRRTTIPVDYDSFYADLEWMLYDLGIPVEVIFGYIRNQITPPPEPQKEETQYIIDFTRFVSHHPAKIGLSARSLFGYWRHYLHLCSENGWTDYTPTRFITAYNEVLVKTGQKPVIYFPIEEYGMTYVKDDNQVVCKGHFPCDSNGNVILEWTSIRVTHPVDITYQSEKSQCGELRITLGPKTIIYARSQDDEDEEEPYWQQLYAGPQTMQFDNKALWCFRSDRKMTQKAVADAIGTSVRTYQKWESGETIPDGHYLIRLMNWLDINNVQSLIKYVELPDAPD